MTELASRTSWDEVDTRADTPIQKLVAGFDEIGEVAIPYARLPRRLRKVCAADFSCWSDIGGQSAASLLNRPSVGVGAVRALLEAATDAVAARRAAAGRPVGAVAAVQRLLDQFDDLDRAILSGRVWAARPQTTYAIAERLGVASVRIQRNQPRAQARLAELLAEPAHEEVAEHAELLRDRLGPYVPADVVDAELCRLDVDPSSETAQVLLYLAGPYVQTGNWFENTKTSGKQHVVAAVDAVFGRCPAPSTARLLEALTRLGMPHEVAATYLQTRVALRRFDDVWVRWGESIPDRAEALLHVHGAPVTAEDILAGIGAETTALRGVREALYADDRFVRASRLTWGLRTWRIDPYRGVFDEIATLIDSSGGSMKIEDVVADVVARFPDVAEGSVRSYLGTLAFVTAGGRVRRRNDSDALPPVPALRTAPGAFRNGDKEIRLAVEVTVDTLRGSGLKLRPAVAAALGIDPGQRRVFNSSHGDVAVIWRLSSPNGPSIGSLRPAALATGANLKDSLVLAFRLDDESIQFDRISAELTGRQRLRLLLGRTVRNPLAALAASLDCRRDDVAAVLRSRGDHDLADLISD
ncbi:hypothetical protein [Mycobacterium sp. 29Ha]|uniref:hypothetical protein n=1 Tax=Mycobacterium sp. 29Ha TaxID=2939268 RepID=UPI002938F917|nr:hypothetical protein [Mycobacterium sp. 29Ha]MDV3133318.1 hypothetical protein [Mycobacterium sp. 29Ha]